MNRPFAIITTRLPPAVCGVGTYSAVLRRHWPNESQPVEFLVVAEADTAQLAFGDDTVVNCAGDGRRLRDALQRIGAADVVLHYAGRAYHRLGWPAWLPSALAEWKRDFPAGRLLVFFHEMPGDLPITSRHFWIGLLQARVIRRLVEIADVVVTNTNEHATRLRRLTKRNDVSVVPISANIEPAESALEQTAARQPGEFVVFGLSFGRLQTLHAFQAHILRWTNEGRISVLHLIGPDGDQFSVQADELIAKWPNSSVVIRHGSLPAAEVSRLLLRGRFALTNVTPETWSKSGAFMACAAHRCTVVRAGTRTESQPLAFTVVADEVAALVPDELEWRTNALADWYRTNAAWPVVAEQLAALFSNEAVLA